MNMQRQHGGTLNTALGGKAADPVLLFDNQSKGSFELLTIGEVAELLKISANGVRRLQQGRHIPFIKIGGSVRFAKADIVRYLLQQRIEPIGQ